MHLIILIKKQLADNASPSDRKYEKFASGLKNKKDDMAGRPFNGSVSLANEQEVFNQTWQWRHG